MHSPFRLQEQKPLSMPSDCITRAAVPERGLGLPFVQRARLLTGCANRAGGPYIGEQSACVQSSALKPEEQLMVISCMDAVNLNEAVRQGMSAAC